MNGKLAPAHTEPRDTYFVSRNSSRKPSQTTRPTRQSIIQTMVPPERMPLPPRNLNMQGNMWPSRQNRAAQYSAKVFQRASVEAAEMNMVYPVKNRCFAIRMAATALSTSHRITTKVKRPPKVR